MTVIRRGRRSGSRTHGVIGGCHKWLQAQVTRQHIGAQRGGGGLVRENQQLSVGSDCGITGGAGNDKSGTRRRTHHAAEARLVCFSAATLAGTRKKIRVPRGQNRANGCRGRSGHAQLSQRLPLPCVDGPAAPVLHRSATLTVTKYAKQQEQKVNVLHAMVFFKTLSTVASVLVSPARYTGLRRLP